MFTRCGIMNNFKLSSRLFSYSFWEGIFSYSDMGEKKKQDLFNEIDQLDKLKKKADYNTGSISKTAAWCLYCVVNYFKPQNIMEIGTFIGKSSWSMLKAQEDAKVENAYLVTCDMSNDISIPWYGKTNFKQYKKKTSTEMFQNEIIKPDLIFFDGRILKEDLEIFQKLVNENTIIVLDDFEGVEKGVINLLTLRNIPQLKSHFLVYPCDKKKSEQMNHLSYSTLAVMLPPNKIELVAQG